jgi:fatty acid desaturase
MDATPEPYSANQPWREEAPGPHMPLGPIDLQAFSAELDALHARLKADLGEADLQHLRKMERWGRLCTVLGYATAWMFPNPLAALLIGLGNVARWGMPAHHVLHRGYDAVPGVPRRFRSEVFARGWRRLVDWPDWILPSAWVHEHNLLHHYHTGQRDDPDLVERNAWIMRVAPLPRPLKWLLLAVFIASWKWLYYAPNTLWAQRQSQRLRALGGDAVARRALPTPGTAWRVVVPGERLLLPVTRGGLEFYARCLLPYALWRFGVLPALFLPLGTGAWSAVLLTSLMAEVIANVYSFLIIGPNHTGDDLHRFEGGVRGRAEFQLQQITGSVNYTGGRDLPDFLQAYLNYQIEHHLWPDLPLLKYRQAAPEVKRICQRHGVPYVEENVFLRMRKLMRVMLGDASMRHTDMVQERARRAAAAPTPTRVNDAMPSMVGAGISDPDR